ncbi:response regulator transcription factor [Solitalea koreensis]|uniref:DNA-binding response regulator, OmpR family, contains REC and winged-helix (WHTH) domain n=1 Tax=Solitalea koreensis TaxID=543615 RepID=A0A521CZV1_9SPHI|nr:response regulator transcription factor [Solitalea koreensis]SMO64954.1 DNA-binding response regulator, OmpR family, contains REC and winged-helix (wHTH) domain [Solitalea koreensis]
MNVLIIEDKYSLSDELATFLKQQSFLCDLAYNSKEATEKIFVNNYDFILLDLGLPDGDGLDILKAFKSIPNRDDSVIVLTARGSTEDKITGLDLGADDYLAKPFSLAELMSRMHAILRRKHRLPSNEINLHGFIIDIQNRLVHFNNQEIKLTKKEFDILNYLVLNKNRVISRMQLTEHIWGDVLEINSDSNFVDVHVKNLRKKLQAHSQIDWFETVRSIGYKIIQ